MATTLVARARQLVAAGPYDAAPAELAALHALVWPDHDAVCQTCRGELGKAYYAIQRWLGQQDSSTISPTANVKKTTTARFKSDSTIYTPHGLGVAYSNDNLTDKAARDIIAADPEATDLFDVLPLAATAEEVAAEQAEQPATPAEQPTNPLPAGFDYAKLASALADEMERRSTPATTTPALTAATGGATTPADATSPDESDDDSDTDDDKPVRLSRMNKDQLVAAHTTELGRAPDAALTNDELRQAIADHRASQPNA